MEEITRSLSQPNTTQAPEREEDFFARLISDRAMIITEIIFYIFVSGIFGLAGTVANVFNVIVFYRQGLKESSNISLFCLSISDWFISFFTFLGAISFTLQKLAPPGNINIGAVFLATVGNPLLYFSRVSMVTTMYLCFERCLCVVLPLTVKLIITRRRSILVLGFLYLHLTLFHAVLFAYISRLSWQWDEATNSSVYQLEEHPMKPFVLQLNQTVNGSFLTTFSVAVVLISSVVMVGGVIRATRKRQEMTTSNSEATKENPSGLSRKDVRLVQMVIYIAILFLSSYLPLLGIEFVEAFIEPGLDMFGKYHNLNQVLWSMVTALCGISASGNIVIYYFISERYRTVFLELVNKEGK